MLLFCCLLPVGVNAQTTGDDSSLITINCAADAYVDSSNPNVNYGTLSTLNVSANNILAYTYLRFDLSSIPSGMFVVNATLNVYLSDEGGKLYWLPGDTVSAYRGQDNSWSEQTITWNNKPAYSSTPTDEWLHGIREYKEYKTWDITKDVQAAQQSGVLTEVLRFSEKYGDDGYLVYRSREGASTPKIDIIYSSTPPSTVPTPTPTPTPTSNTPTPPSPTPSLQNPTPTINTPTPTPIPEYSLIALIPLLISTLLIVALLKLKRKPKEP